MTEELTKVVAQSAAELRQEITGLRQEMRGGLAGVGEAIDSIHRVLDDHETRLVQLEEKAA